jgi:transposase
MSEQPDPPTPDTSDSGAPDSKPPRRGRPTDCTPEATKSISGAISLGLTYKDAALAADVSYKTFINWMKRGRDEAARLHDAGPRAKPRARELPFLEFFYAIKKAKAKGKARLVKTIFQHSETSWQAAAWILERRHPRQFALRTRSEVTGKDGGPIQHEHATVTLVMPDNGRGDATQPTTTPNPSAGD